MSAPTSLPIAQLRAAGCTVGTLPGHWPLRGTWGYVVTLPGSVRVPDRWLSGVASLHRSQCRARDVTVSAYARRGDDVRASRADIRATEDAVTVLLVKLAAHVSTAGGAQ